MENCAGKLCSERSSDRFHILALAIAMNIINENVTL
jgi:hypothetical protein